MTYKVGYKNTTRQCYETNEMQN